jgi:F-type H+-transporting ATPase subunit gamma
MAGTKEIKRRIKSVKNTKKITKAMELVAASKMKRVVSSTLASRLYAEYSWDVLTSIAQNIEDTKNVFFNLREKAENTKDKVLLILVTSNRGLCGAYNAQIIKKSVSLVKDLDVDIITIGKKGDVAMRRLNQNILASFFELPDHINLRDVNPISDYILSEYQKGNYDKVLVAYTDFVSALTQRPNIKQVLPISKIELKDLIDNLPEDIPKTEKSNTPKNTDYLFEGDQEKFIGKLAEKITKMQIYQMLLESNASEQSSRMIAMKNASEASGEMIDDLTLMFNKARQSNITREISEISAGMASIN